MADPVSWLVVEAGWDVVTADGERVGEVREIVGDTGKDIFNGLVVSPGLLKAARYVPAEVVGSIVEGTVELTIDERAFHVLDAHEEPPPSEQLR
jgi:sporulation protein YlmC with PRC-barrel domain